MFWVKFCAFYNLFCGLLHVAFLWIWRGQKSWHSLSPRVATTLDIFNIQLAIVFFLVFYAYFFHAAAILTTPLGRTLAIGMLLFWVARAMDELLPGARSVGLLLFILLGVAAHAVALWPARRWEGGGSPP